MMVALNSLLIFKALWIFEQQDSPTPIRQYLESRIFIRSCYKSFNIGHILGIEESWNIACFWTEDWINICDALLKSNSKCIFQNKQQELGIMSSNDYRLLFGKTLLYKRVELFHLITEQVASFLHINRSIWLTGSELLAWGFTLDKHQVN